MAEIDTGWFKHPTNALHVRLSTERTEILVLVRVFLQEMWGQFECVVICKHNRISSCFDDRVDFPGPLWNLVRFVNSRGTRNIWFFGKDNEDDEWIQGYWGVGWVWERWGIWGEVVKGRPLPLLMSWRGGKLSVKSICDDITMVKCSLSHRSG